jgi:hypothetical protein
MYSHYDTYILGLINQRLPDSISGQCEALKRAAAALQVHNPKRPPDSRARCRSGSCSKAIIPSPIQKQKKAKKYLFD